jgi:hypothetical protein
MDLAGDVALKAAQDLFLGPASGDVVLGGLVAVHADQEQSQLRVNRDGSGFAGVGPPFHR